jgi:sec-independent protein translocase protein TatC
MFRRWRLRRFDLKASTGMSLIEHLTELRKRLLWSIVALLIGMGIAWNYVDHLLAVVERPLSGNTYLLRVKAQAYDALKVRFPGVVERFKLEPEGTRGPQEERKLNYTTPLEPFFVQIKLSMLAGAVFALPVILYQLWRFLAPGLTGTEKRMVLPFITAGTVSFLVGALFFLLAIWPVIINFSLSYENAGLRSWFNLTAYVDFCLRLLVVFGLVFELPVVAMILARIGLLTGRFLARQRRFALLASAIVAAFHADLVTMFVIWIPLYFMYEVSIWMAYLFWKAAAVEAPPVAVSAAA